MSLCWALSLYIAKLTSTGYAGVKQWNREPSGTVYIHVHRHVNVYMYVHPVFRKIQG